MEVVGYTFCDLFEQLGLADSEENIVQFIDRYRGVNQQAPLYQASFWNKSQSKFIYRAITEETEWTDIVEQLDKLL